MNLHIRQELPKDHHIVETLTRDAFWDIYKPGCDEHYLVHCLRKTEAFIPELNLVCEIDNKIVGHILYSRAYVEQNNTTKHEVLCLGPVSVRPNLQKQGVGSTLIKHSLCIATKMGFKAVILYGSPLYYPKFGFKNAQEYGITTHDGQNFDAFMALELSPDSLRNINGAFFADPAFNIDDADAEEYNKAFPTRKKHVCKGQLTIDPHSLKLWKGRQRTIYKF